MSSTFVADARVRQLHSANTRTLVVSWTRSSFGDGTFAAAGPQVWNSLLTQWCHPGDQVSVSAKSDTCHCWRQEGVVWYGGVWLFKWANLCPQIGIKVKQFYEFLLFCKQMCNDTELLQLSGEINGISSDEPYVSNQFLSVCGACTSCVQQRLCYHHVLV